MSDQSVRHWLNGRSFPGKAKCHLLEDALTFKLDFSEGGSTQSVTVEQALGQTDTKTLLAISKMPPRVRILFGELAAEFVAAQKLGGLN